MPMQLVDATVSNFDSVFEKFREDSPNNKANFILFLGDDDPETSLSWCYNCERAEPVIMKTLEACQDDIAVLRAYVGDLGEWRKHLHPWRIDERFKLTHVPTLIRWEKEAIHGRLEEHEAHLKQKINSLLSKE